MALDATRRHTLYASPATGIGTFAPAGSGEPTKDADAALFPARAVRIYVFADGAQPAIVVTDRQHVLDAALPPIEFASVDALERGYLPALYPGATAGSFAARIQNGGAFPLFWTATPGGSR
jgi:hypothetical protein